MLRMTPWIVALVALSASSASAIGPRIERYSMEGYLDRAPEGSQVVGTVRIAREGASRTIVITASEDTDQTIVCSSCDSPLAVGYEFALIGDEKGVDELFHVSAGTKISSVFTRTRTDRYLILSPIGG